MRIIDPMKAFMPVGGNKTDQSYEKLRDRLLPLEIVKGFCDADDICYRKMHPKISWDRAKTIGYGDEILRLQGPYQGELRRVKSFLRQF